MLVPLLVVLQNLVKLLHNFIGAPLAHNVVVVRKHSSDGIRSFFPIQLWLLNFQEHLAVVHILSAVLPDYKPELLASS